MATLKISDLSVGDWVRYDDRICQIAEIHHLSYTFGCKEMSSDPRVTLYYEDDMPTYQESVPFKDIHPIPITAEILEKNGFVKNGGVYIWSNKKHRVFVCLKEFSYSVIEEMGEQFVTMSSRIEVSQLYVHQLQHALRLAGVDKEINL